MLEHPPGGPSGCGTSAYHHNSHRTWDSTNFQRIPARGPFGCLMYFVANRMNS
jgi:hypothetical protein